MLSQKSKILREETENIPQKARQVTEQEISNYDFKGRDPRGLIIEKDIHIEMIEGKLKHITKTLYDVSKNNLELE